MIALFRKHVPTILLLALAALVLTGCVTTSYPPEGAPGDPALARALEKRLYNHVEMLAGEIGERHCYRPEAYERAASYIETELSKLGYTVNRQAVHVPDNEKFACGETVAWNIEAVKPGTTRAEEVIVLGAHYDSKVATPKWNDSGPPLPDQAGTPGASDNASGVAGVIEVARALAETPLERTIRFVAFANEEPPFYQTDSMGSVVYARALAADSSLEVVGMISLEQLGCFSKTPGKKRWPFLGITGLTDETDYIAFLTNLSSRRFAKSCAQVFAEDSTVPVKVMPVPAFAKFVAWSDDWSFWKEGIPAFSVCDTAYLRNDHYHELTDTPDSLDYEPMAEVVRSCVTMVADLANAEPARSWCSD